MLETVDLCVSFGAVKALSGMNLTVPRGEVTAVIGANGAGKSTLMRALAGLVTPQSGQVLFDGRSIAGNKPEDIVRNGLALVPEGLAKETNLAVLLVEQNAVTALRVATTGVVLNLGEVVKSGPAHEISSDEELRHAYLGY